ncbi:hypothetical protein AX15_001889 [Amanita polypyramis BW_CC]|nr:hypothetical protein AX15_001889 [Amanita polypyramis BW_CC]
MESPFEAPSILIEPPEDENQQLGNEQEYSTSLYSPFNEDDFFNEHFYNPPHTEPVSTSHDPNMSFPLFLETNFSTYRSQPGSPHSPLLDAFPDDVSDLLNIDCPSPGAMSDSSYTPSSPYPTTPLSESLGNFHLPEFPHSPRLRSLSDAGPNGTIAPGDVFGIRSRSYNGSYEHVKPPGTIAASNGFAPEAYIGSPTEQDNLSPHALAFPNPRMIGHRPMLSEPNIPTNSLLMEASGADMRRQLSPIRTEDLRHCRSHSETTDLLSPDTAQIQFSRGRREHRGGSRSQSRRSSPYTLPNTSQESFSSVIVGHDVGGRDSYLHPDRSRHHMPNLDPAPYPGTPISEASSSSQNLVSPSTSVMVMSPEFNDMSSVPSVAPRKVGSKKLDEASDKRRKNEAKHSCPVCNRTLTTKHNFKNHMKSHYNIKDQICEDCNKGFTTGHVLKRHWRICKKRKSRLGLSDDTQDIDDPDES